MPRANDRPPPWREIGIPETEQDFLTPEEVEKKYRVSRRNQAAWRERQNGPPYVKAGHRSVRYPKAALEAWFKDRLRIPIGARGTRAARIALGQDADGQGGDA